MATQFSITEGRKWKAPFFTIWTGQAISLLGSQLVQFALIWYLTQRTSSGTVLAIATLVGLVPQVFIGPFLGALVDRWNRRVIMIVSDGVIALATIGLAVLFALGTPQIWHIYLLMFIRSLAGGFHYNAMGASTSLMVPKENLPRIQGLNQTLQGGMNVLSAPLGALLLEVLPMQGVLAIDVFSAAFAIVPLFFIAVPQPERIISADNGGSNTSMWDDLREGLRYVRTWPGLLTMLIMAALINFLITPGFSLLPLLIKDHFGGGAPQLAAMNSGWGIGVIAGGLLLGVWGGFKRQIATSMLGLIVMGAATAVIGFLPAGLFLAAIAAMLLAGIFNVMTNGPIMGVLQAAVDPQMQGRVFTLISSACSAMMPIGLIVAGPLSDLVGIQAWFIVGGIVCVLMGLAGFFVPALMSLADGHPNQEIAEQVILEAQPAAAD
ncbi:MAG: MFS transporter [Anaerolineales bacterium]|nr:MFS transporter [Anaerolineales bacterium]